MARCAVIAAGILLASVAISGAQTIGLYAESAGNNHETIATAGVVTTVYVVIHPGPLVTSLKAAAFSVSIPECEGMLYLGDTEVVGSKVGSAPTGVILDFETCLTLPAHVLTLSFFTTEAFECCEFHLFGYPGSAQVEGVDCSDTLHMIMDRVGWLSRSAPEVINRFPADGATNVSTDVTMSWDEFYCADPIGDVFEFHFDFGETDPPPTVLSGASAFKSYHPGNLQPNTTYYWRADGYATSMPVWSFTTAGSLPVEQTTWGGIKALFQ